MVFDLIFIKSQVSNHVWIYYTNMTFINDLTRKTTLPNKTQGNKIP